MKIGRAGNREVLCSYMGSCTVVSAEMYGRWNVTAIVSLVNWYIVHGVCRPQSS